MRTNKNVWNILNLTEIYHQFFYPKLLKRAPNGLGFDVHRLQLAELVQRLDPVLPAQPALLVAAEGQLRRVDVEVVDVAVAGLQPAGHSVRAKQVSVENV